MVEQRLMDEIMSKRLRRRDVLRRAAVLGLSAPVIGGLLAACGGDDDDDDDAPTATSAGAATEPAAAATEPAAAAATPTAGADTGTTTPADAPTATSAGGTDASTATTGEPTEGQRGGTLSVYEAGNPASLDPYISGSQGQAFWSSYSYSRLFMSASGPGIPGGSLEVVPDAAASSEVTEDGLTYTVTLRDNVMFHPPLDRAMTADDVVHTWNRMAGTLPDSDAASERFEDIEFVTACEKVDDLTVTLTLESPYPFMLSKLADPKIFFIMPQEVDTEFNPAEEVIGSGPWVLQNYTPDNRAEFVRHEKWHLGPDIPYADGVTVNIVGEYATQLSQFLGGNLDWVTVQGSDLQRTMDEVEGIQLYERPAYPLSVLNFSPNEARWEDERLRRAVSMALDRDAMLEAAYGIPEIEEAGIEVPRYWHNVVPAAFAEYWLDPKGDEIDPDSAANFMYDPEAAQALVEEAGGGFDTELHYAASNSRYGEPYRIMSELIVQYLGQIGINVTALEEDYNTKFLGENGTSSGNFNGLMWIPQTRTDPFAYIRTQYLSPNHGIYGRWQDEELTALAAAIEPILEPEKLVQAIKDFQNAANKKMYVVPMVFGAAPTYVAYQPWVKNALVYQTFAQGGPTENLPHYWLDK
jgi:peptide/nickel transport system substrate-binding protein